MESRKERFASTGKGVTRSVQQVVRRRVRQATAALGAVDLGRAISDGAIELACQPIARLEHSSTILYRECTALLRRADGLLLRPDLFMFYQGKPGALERFDAFTVRRAMALLSDEPSRCLGVNLSPYGVGDLAWWESVLGELARRPEIARRLVFEIQEATVLTPGTGRTFRKALHAAGCRVAINGFGVRYGVQTAMEIDAPDIIKLDRSLLSGLTAKRLRRRLAGWVALACDLAPCVVVEGVESHAALQAAQEAGAQWGQGSLLGRERLIPRLGGLWSIDRGGEQLASVADRQAG
ncbi:EAL domain-containing protein (putative c-di-GMP-specific phosphodiesterase class I) [Burkholderia ambifaria]|nr:EAL domain-containing protein [Burkholderia ambifaria]MDR6504041.1 EAL domain-containing protein (putative c-di-GMP-specific phosphodiesterase class I) [Burkholderia ambifaria]